MAQGISKSFIKSSFIYSFIGALPLASSVLLLPFYGNSDLLSTEDLGLLAIYIALSELVRILFIYSADNYLGINYIHNSDTPEQKRRFIGTTALFLIIFGGGMAMIFSAVGDFLFTFIFPGKDVSFYPYGFLSILTGLFAGIFRAYTVLIVYRQKPRPYFWSNMLHFVLVVVFSVGGLYLFPMSLDGPIWGRFISATATFVWTMVYFGRESRFKYSKSVLSDLIKYCSPLFVFYLLSWIIANIDRYFILGILSEKDVAVFDFAVKITLMIDLVQGGLSAAINPKVFQIWKRNGDKQEGSVEINKYFNGFTVINQISMPLLFIAVVLFVPLIITNTDLYQSFSYLPVLFAGMVSKVWFLYLLTPVYYFKKTQILPFAFAFVALIQVITTYGFINLFGIEGAVWANFLIKILQVIVLYFFVKRFYSFSINAWKFIFYPVMYILILLATTLFFSDVNIYLVSASHLIILIITGYILFKKELIPFFKSLAPFKKNQHSIQ
ncbi:MAG TPA: oligosaccharide flippase family protein [Bacteroidales bacterium]|nr:oligosaccharide flippase family protein [Bacteroidales bacterium]